MERKAVLEKLDRITDLPTLPAVAMEVNKMLQDHDTSIQQLSQTIEKDQSIASRILKLVNSAFFGVRSKVDDISYAVSLLGFNTVRNAVFSVSVIQAFSGRNTLDGFNITDFWTHSVAVAVISRHLADKTGLQPPDDCFMGGLLHDIGKVVLCQYFSDLFEKVWTAAQNDNLSFYEAEKREAPIDHARIGEYLAKKWQLPVRLVDAIGCHHAVRKSVSNFELLLIVHMADFLVNRIMVDPQGRRKHAVCPDAVKAMKPQLETVSEWFPAVSEEIKSACAFFLQ